MARRTTAVERTGGRDILTFLRSHPLVESIIVPSTYLHDSSLNSRNYGVNPVRLRLRMSFEPVEMMDRKTKAQLPLIRAGQAGLEKSLVENFGLDSFTEQQGELNILPVRATQNWYAFDALEELNLVKKLRAASSPVWKKKVRGIAKETMDEGTGRQNLQTLVEHVREHLRKKRPALHEVPI